MAKPPPQSELERLVRYCHPAKILGTTRLPGRLTEAQVAQLYDTDPETYRALVAAFASEARAAGAPKLPGRILALGDSITDDLGSWAEILRAGGTHVVNAGVSGDATTSALARAHRLPAAEHAIVLLGTNDARRQGGGEMLVSNRETRRNLRALDAALRPRFESLTWITPPPVEEARIGRDPAMAEAEVAWRCDDVAAKADIVREECPDAVDLWPAFGAEHLAADGLHPSATGQRLIAALVIRGLAA